MTATCPVCGKKFETHQYGTGFCSVGCQFGGAPEMSDKEIEQQKRDYPEDGKK